MTVCDFGDGSDKGAAEELDDGPGLPAGGRGDDEAGVHPAVDPAGAAGGAPAGVPVGDRLKAGGSPAPATDAGDGLDSRGGDGRRGGGRAES